MSADLLRAIDRFAGRHVLIIGEAMLDSYLEGSTGRLCREAPVPVVEVQQRTDAPGGAANTAVNVASLGGRSSFLSVVGDDAEGRLLREALEARGVSTAHLLVQPGRRTIAKQRVVAAGQMLVRFDQGDTGPVDAETEQRLLDRLVLLAPRCHAIIVSDYGYGVLTPRLIAALAEIQARRPRVLVADAKDLIAYRQVGVTAVKPNYEEAIRLLDLAKPADPRERAALIARHEARFLDITGARIAAVTLDTDGALVFERDRPAHRTYTRPCPHSRAAGAGDTFVSALTLALAARADTPTAAELAQAAAAIVVGKDGTAACTAAELRAHFNTGDQYVSGLDRLAAQMDAHRRQGRRIVFTNGCFDILHRGHIAFLNRAKALGDVLVVGVNTDTGVRRLKGPDRPINPLEDRVQVLAALSCVDHIVAFDDDLPDRLIGAIRPDVFVKGGNYTRATLPEAALVERLGGIVEILPYLEEHSTTGLLTRIRAVGSGQRAAGSRQPAVAVNSAESASEHSLTSTWHSGSGQSDNCHSERSEESAGTVWPFAIQNPAADPDTSLRSA